MIIPLLTLAVVGDWIIESQAGKNVEDTRNEVDKLLTAIGVPIDGITDLGVGGYGGSSRTTIKWQVHRSKDGHLVIRAMRNSDFCGSVWMKIHCRVHATLSAALGSRYRRATDKDCGPMPHISLPA